MNEKRTPSPVPCKLLGWLLGGFVAFLALAVLLAALSLVAFAGWHGIQTIFFVAFVAVAVLLAALALYGIRRLAE